MWRALLYFCGGVLAIARATLAYLRLGDRPVYPGLLVGGLLCFWWATWQLQELRRSRGAAAVRVSVAALETALSAPGRGTRWTVRPVDLVALLLFALFVWPTPWEMGSETHPRDGSVLHFRTQRWGGLTQLWVDGEWHSPVD